MCCSAPSTSTNCKSIQRILSFSICFNTDATVIFFDFAGVLEAIAMSFTPWTDPPFRPGSGQKYEHI